MAFAPTPVALTMGRFFYVPPAGISWDKPEDMYLIDADVLPGDGGGPLPAGRPFEVTGQNQSGTASYATLSAKRPDCIGWEPAFAAGRQIILRLDVHGVVQNLHVELFRI